MIFIIPPSVSWLRTADITAPGAARVGTSVMGESILREMDKLVA